MRPKTPITTPITTPIRAPVLSDFEDPPEIPFAPSEDSDASEAVVELVVGATGRDTEDDAALKHAVSFPSATLNKLDSTIPAFWFPVWNASTAYVPFGTSTIGHFMEPAVDDVFVEMT